MQSCIDSVNIFDSEQTTHPFTEQTRLLNLKEANSTGNCVGVMNDCGINEVDVVANAKQQLQDYKVYTNQDITNIFTQNQKMKFDKFKSMMGLKDSDTRPGKLHLDQPIDMDESAEEMRIKEVNGQKIEHFISQDNRYMDPTSPDLVNNATPKDYTYNSSSDWRAPSFNQWTRINDDDCNYENRLRIGSKPMKYYVNQYNSPQVAPFMEFSIIGNQKAYEVRNEFERPIPTRLNPIYPTNIEPYQTTPFLGAAHGAREYANTSSNLRWGNDVRVKKSQAALTERDWNRFEPNVHAHVVQNSGQFPVQGAFNTAVDKNGYYDPLSQNNVLVANSAWNRTGISSRDILHNLIDTSGC